MNFESLEPLAPAEFTGSYTSAFGRFPEVLACLLTVGLASCGGGGRIAVTSSQRLAEAVGKFYIRVG